MNFGIQIFILSNATLKFSFTLCAFKEQQLSMEYCREFHRNKQDVKITPITVIDLMYCVNVIIVKFSI